jgi:lambda family phage portal protein
MGFLDWFRRKPKAMQRSAYAGASFTRLSLDWVTSTLSADQEIKGDLRLLRARARELCRNTSLARRAVSMYANNVVGADGMTLQMRLATTGGRPLDNQNDAIETAFYEWGKPEHASLDGRLSWVAIQRLMATNRFQDGEALLQMVPVADSEFGFAVQVLDPDLLDHEYNLPATADQNEIRMGVELSAYGKPLAYWLWTKHPSDYGTRDRVRRRVPAEQIIHWFKPARPGQTRGVPDLAPVMSDLNMLRGAEEAELVAMRTGAAKMGFMVPKGDDPPAIDPNSGSPFQVPPSMDASPGVIDTLPPGYEFQAWDPQHPGANVVTFAQFIQRKIAAGVNMPYHTLTGDLSGVNYSSARVGELDARDGYKADQRDMIDHVHARVFERWLQMALLKGAIDLPTKDYTNYLGYEFVGRRWAWVDPKNDLEAAVLAIDNKLESRTHILAEQGRDFADVVRDLEKEQVLTAAAGLNPKPEAEDKPAEEKKPEEPAPERVLRLARRRPR